MGLICSAMVEPSQRVLTIDIRFTEDFKEYSKRTFMQIKAKNEQLQRRLSFNNERISNIKSILKPNDLYKDSEYPPDTTSIWYTARNNLNSKEILWKRAKDFNSSPYLKANNSSMAVKEKCIMQGEINDSAFLIAAIAVAQDEHLLEKIIPLNQNLFGSDYSGILMCRFWLLDDWHEVYIDDLLPVHGDTLIYARGANDFWISYLEKAYAKVYGCYELIEGLSQTDTLVDLTGGLAEHYSLDTEHLNKNIFDNMLKAYQRNSIITCTLLQTYDTTVSNQVYIVKAVYKMQDCVTNEFFNLIKIKNPWMNSIKPFCGENWKTSLDEDSKKLLDLKTTKESNEFFMAFDDFCKYFSDITICTLLPTSDRDTLKTNNSGYYRLVKGTWIAHQTAAGIDVGKFAKNPQFLLELKQPDKEAITDTTDVLIALMQDYRRAQSQHSYFNVKLYQIGFIIYKVDSGKQIINHSKLDTKYFEKAIEYERSGFSDTREVIKRIQLKFGYYVIIPCTVLPQQVSRFSLRLFSEFPLEIIELT